MNVYETKTIGDIISGNSYVGRGILAGKTPDGNHAAIAYFIMGRSENSRNRVFRENGRDLTIYPFDESKVSDPSLIIYSPIRIHGNEIIVTNGDQTDTIYEHLDNGGSFESALETRCFEPDAPNFTPRISAMLSLRKGDFTYKMSILKSADAEGSACSRFTYSYPSISGVGHFIHTYICDGDPIPTFCGEPERVTIPNSIDDFTREIWNNLDRNNRISLYVRYIDLSDLSEKNRLINKWGN